MAKKIVFIFIGVLILAALGVFVISAEGVTVSPEVEQVVEDIGIDITSEVAGYVEEFVSKREISAQTIENIQQVDFDSLPKEVNIENVGDHNLAIYQVDYTEDGKDEKVFVITYSVEELKAQGDLIIAHDKRQFLNFGYVGVATDSGFLKTATGVETSLDKGYVMVRDGSITAVSTNLEVVKAETGNLEIIVYKNGEAIGFGNSFSTLDIGLKKDYDVQAKDTVNFLAGDIISVYINAEGDVSWQDVITIVEITTVN